jgi:toluene monooxygenase system ferredoxin subunit
VETETGVRGRVVRVCADPDLWEGEIRGVKAEGYEVIVLRLPSGEVRAYYGLCPHTLSRLEEGDIDEQGNIVCSAHGWTFDPGTGRSINPTGACLPPFPVHIIDGAIHVELPNMPAKDWVVRNLGMPTTAQGGS